MLRLYSINYTIIEYAYKNTRNALNGLSCVCDSPGSYLVLGDFNLPSIDWNKHIDPSDPKSKEILTFCSDHGCVQLITSPTCQGNFLDLVLTNDPMIVSSVMVGMPFSTSDHDSITLSIITPSNDYVNSQSMSVGCASKPVVYDYCNADWAGFNLYCTSVN